LGADGVPYNPGDAVPLLCDGGGGVVTPLGTLSPSFLLQQGVYQAQFYSINVRGGCSSVVLLVGTQPSLVFSQNFGPPSGNFTCTAANTLIGNIANGIVFSVPSANTALKLQVFGNNSLTFQNTVLILTKLQ
jgi:hypothetical protein